jgi:hypothetical protein
MTEYMKVANIEQRPYYFWMDADAIIARKNALKEALK